MKKLLLLLTTLLHLAAIELPAQIATPDLPAVTTLASTDTIVVNAFTGGSSKTRIITLANFEAKIQADLSLAIGEDIQAWSANLDLWSAKTPYNGSLTIATGKTFNVTNSITISGTDGSTLNIGAGGTLGNAATKDVGTTAGTVAAGDDSRFKSVGTTAGTVAAGDDSRFAAMFMISVKAYGAIGDGVADDTAAIQAAIDAAKLKGISTAPNGTALGGIVYFPEGGYKISSPLILPRTNATPTNVVWLVGQNTRSTQIIGSSGFPTGRALIEWDTTSAIRAWGQRIENLTLACAPVANTRAIHYKLSVQGSTAYATYHAERMQLDLLNIAIEASNQHHQSVIRIEGGIWFSNWDTVRGDFVTNTHNYDTLLIELDSDIATADGLGGTTEPGWTTDVPGFAYGRMKDIQGGGRRGGKSRTIKGRLLRSTVDTAFANGGSAGAIEYEFKYSVGNIFIALGSEGLMEDTQYQLTNCFYNHFQAINLGTPDATGAVGLKMINSSDNTFEGRMAMSTQSPFQANSSKAVTLDATSKRNRFTNFGLRTLSTASAEITDNGAQNFFSGTLNSTNAGGGTVYTLGADPAAATEIPSQAGHAGQFLKTDGTSLSFDTPAGGSTDPRTTLRIFDDFTGGSTSSGQIGAAGWNTFQGSTNVVAGVAGHPGIIQRSTTSTSGTLAAMYLGNSASNGPLWADDTVSHEMMVRLNTNDANTTVRVGLTQSGASATPGEAAYFEKLDADTNWFIVTRHSSIQTRADTGVAVGTGWITFRVRRTDATHFGFTINGGTETTTTANLPTGVALQPVVQIANSAASAKTIDIDYADVGVAAMTRP